MKNSREKIKGKMVLAAVLVGVVLSVFTFLFVQDVRTQLWEQSINTIMESTQQGCDTLRVQLHNGYETMDAMADYITPYSADQKKDLELFLGNYVQCNHNISLYVADGTYFPSIIPKDETAETLLLQSTASQGILAPHVSSVTGETVFNLFQKITLRDGTEASLVKEYAVDSIVDSFSLSFYNGSGFSYVVNTEGDVLIRSPHPNSNKTFKNLFDMLPEKENDPDSIQQFAQSLMNLRTGWAVFYYQNEETVFGYTPLRLYSDWYLISIIPKDVVDAQTNQILMRTLFLVGGIILGIFLLVSFYLRFVIRTNKRLRNQADYIGHLYNAVPEGIALISPEEPYRFLQLNPEGLRLLGYSKDAADAATQRFVRDVVPVEDYDKVTQILQNARENEQKSLLENRILKADGGFYWIGGIVEKTLDEEGQQVFIATFHDITGEKLAAEKREREKLQERITLVGALSNAYPLIVNMNLTKDTVNFIYIKPGLLIDLGEQKTYRELFADMVPMIHPEQLEEFQSCFALSSLCQVLGQQKKEVFIETKMLLTDGAYHWVSTQIIYVDNPYSDDKLAILISRRIDEQRYAEEQQRQALQSALDNAMVASKAKSEFLSNMSHDIRTPINAIVGMTAIARTHLDNTDRVTECLQKIDLSSKHLLSLINDILDMSKIESGKLSLRKELFNFAELISDVVELVKLQAQEKQLTIDVRLAILKNEVVIGDSLRVRQICINILSNAVKYTAAGGHIFIEVKQESCSRRGYQNYIFRCADTGMGMPEEFMEKLFMPFERGQDSASSKVMGTGLGMAITKNMVDLMSGDISVESKQGVGSTFTITLPLQIQDTPQEELEQEWRGVHTLIVDDDLQIAESAAELLHDLGLRAEFTVKGIEAVKIVLQAASTSDPYQLVIVDWKMPDLDGVEVTRQIRAGMGSDRPVIILTAYDWGEIGNEAKAAGVTAFLSKPFYRSKICSLFNELSGEENQAKDDLLPEQYDFTGKRILLVEDNEINREIAMILLEEMDILVEEVFDGEMAVKKVEDSPEEYFDLILMDVQMPKLDGYEATKAIRALPRQDVQSIPIIAMTANAFDEDVRMALRAGMDAHFAKPIDLEELKHLLYHYLLCT